MPNATNTDPDAEIALKGAAKTREAIAKSARHLFAHQGYAETSVRAIAARAGADPALVIRYFTSKENLFLETVKFRGFFEEAMAGPLDGLGQRIVWVLLTDERDAGISAYRAMMRATSNEVVRERLLEATRQMFVEPLTPRLKGQDAALRARLVAVQVSGLIDAIAVLEDADLAGVDPERIAAVYGAALQSLIDPSPEAD